MNPDQFRQLYDYNFWANRQVWDCVMQLTDEQFAQDLGYSHGSVRDQIIHTLATEYAYFTGLKAGEIVRLHEVDFPDRAAIRQQWDEVEAYIRAYLADLTPDELMRMMEVPGRPPIYVWEALVQVVNHGTDHRAQTLAGLHHLGAPTVMQDFVFHAIESRGRG